MELEGSREVREAGDQATSALQAGNVIWCAFRKKKSIWRPRPSAKTSSSHLFILRAIERMARLGHKDADSRFQASLRWWSPQRKLQRYVKAQHACVQWLTQVDFLNPLSVSPTKRDSL